MGFDIEEILADPKFQQIANILIPYLPVIKRQGTTWVMVFIDHLQSGDLASADRLVYEKATWEERQKLSDIILAGGLAAVKEQYDNIQLMKDILVKVLIGLLLSAL